jgi:mannose-1-phosphate guanylyltransferase
MQNTITDHLYVVILCGGGGTRLWPLSRKATPKQFIKLIGEDNLFVKTLERAKLIVPDDHIYIMTNKDYLINIQQDAPNIPPENIIAEPEKKNTALAMGVVAGIINARDNNAVIINLASDHLVADLDAFKTTVLAAAQVAAKGDSLVTIGIEPTFAHTGYGYIQAGDKQQEVSELPVYKVSGFSEKPNKETAEEYIETGKYYWNANLYTWSTSLILQEFATLAPELSAHIDKIVEHVGQNDYQAVLQTEYHAAKEEAIDTAISEKTSHLLVIPGDFGWTDIGSWNVVHDEAEQDSEGNALISRAQGADWIKYNTANSLVSTAKKTIVTIGLQDVMIVDTEDALLVARKDNAQDVKRVIEELKQRNKQELL